MKSLNKYRNVFENKSFDLDHEANMVQSRILSTLLEVIEDKGLTQADLEALTGLKQPFLSAVFNNRKKINMEHIALLQNALDIVLQPPSHLSKDEHLNKFYNENDYEGIKIRILELACNHPMQNIFEKYTSRSNTNVWLETRMPAVAQRKTKNWQEELSNYPMSVENY